MLKNGRRVDEFSLKGTGMTANANGAADKPDDAPKRVCLTRREYTRVIRWISTNWERLKGMTKQEATDEVAVLVDKKISVNTLMDAFNDAEREWPGKTQTRKGTGKGKVGGRVRFVATQVALVAAVVELLAESLGHKLSDAERVDIARLRLIASGRDGGQLPE